MEHDFGVNEEIINKMIKSKSFNKTFNKLFEELNHSDINNDGYDEWFKANNADDSAVKCNSVNEFDAIIRNKKSHMNNVTIRQELADFCGTGMNYGNINRDEVVEYTSDVFSKLAYDDLKSSHENSLIPISGDESITNKTVNELSYERSININPYDKVTSENILLEKGNESIHNANNRAFQLARESEITEQRNQLFFQKFKQICQ